MRSRILSKPVEFPALNYAAAAKDSYRQFTELKKAGKIAATTKFQVSLPTAVAVLSGFIVSESQALVEKPYTEALKKEVDEIAQAIPHQELAIQWDVAHEVLFLAGWQLETFVDRSKEGLLRRIVDLGNAVPSDIDLGFHLCYGDPGHKHLVEPSDLGLSVELANAIVGRSSRPVQWIHMPVPRDRKDDAYFEPLKKLQIAAYDRALSRTCSSHRWRRGGAFAGGNCEAASARIRRCVRMRLRSPRS